MKEIIILAKIKFDLRDPDEAYFAQHEIESILGAKVKPVKTIPALFKDYPFNKPVSYTHLTLPTILLV